jgi:four helix bundle protein
MSNPLATQDAVETWKVAHRFVLDVYKLSRSLPADEQHGLIPKLRTSSVKVASNIVEGYARKNEEGYASHLTESQAALEETKYSLLVARDLGYISEESYATVVNDAEEISERLDRLQSQLAGRQQVATHHHQETAHIPQQAAHTPSHVPAPEIPAAQAPAEAPKKRPSAFGVKKSVTNTWGDLMGWLKGGNQIKNERYDNVWTEESAVTSYLEEPNTPPRA